MSTRDASTRCIQTCRTCRTLTPGTETRRLIAPRRWAGQLFVEGKNLREVAMFVSEKLSTIQGVTATATAFRLKTYKHHGVLMDGQDEYERLKISP